MTPDSLHSDRFSFHFSDQRTYVAVRVPALYLYSSTFHCSSILPFKYFAFRLPVREPHLISQPLFHCSASTFPFHPLSHSLPFPTIIHYLFRFYRITPTPTKTHPANHQLSLCKSISLQPHHFS